MDNDPLEESLANPYHSLKYLDNNNKDFFRLIINGWIK